ncbi:MAG: SPFH domain-containing protein [Planctomycetes bacterium]|nr:SPFH domain-containing protein [Planctomycetota bacterium]
MGLWDKLRGELIDIIQWTDDSGDTLVHRFPRYENEIKYGAQLVVRESQAAVFVDQGKIADVFGPGMVTLETQNLPILSTLKGWKYGFHSPFKAEVYFVCTRQFTDLKWGTKHPLMMRDAEFGPVRLRAFGTYAMRATDPAAMIREIAGTNAHFTTAEITDQLRNLIVTRFADLVGESRIPVLELAANFNELGDFVAERIRPEFQAYGLDVTKLLVENISLPPEVEAALDKRSSMGVIGNLSAYAQFQTANAMEKAAENPGGMAAGGMGMGMGFAMANQMGAAMAGQPAAQPGAAPPPLPGQVQYFVALGGKQAGPFDAAALKQQALAGQLTGETLVWTQGMAAWTAAAKVPELAEILGQVPPPLPPKA